MAGTIFYYLITNMLYEYESINKEVCNVVHEYSHLGPGKKRHSY